MGNSNQSKPQTMTGDEFLHSDWIRQGESSEGELKVKSNYKRWASRVGNLGLLEQAGQLWSRLISGQVTGQEKAVIIGSLLYLITPVDLIPDMIPVIGWLDDFGVAVFALSYLRNQADKAVLSQPVFEVPDSILSSQSMTHILHTTAYKGLPYKVAELQTAAEELGISGYADMASDLENDLGGGFFRILFAGKYNTGKSTLINAWLGKDYLPVGPVPTTSALIHILADIQEALYSEQPSGETVIHQSIADLHNTSDSAIKEARRLTLFLPESALPDGVVFIDSPGLEDPRLEISALTLQEAPAADAIVVVLNAKYIKSKPDALFIGGLLTQDRERKLFFVLTHIDDIPKRELEQLITEIKQWLATLGVMNSRLFPLSAKLALNSSKNGSNTAEFNQFRDAVLSFLQKDASEGTRKRFIRQANAIKEGLLDACDGVLDLAEKTKEEQQQTRVIMEKAQDQAKALLAKQESTIYRKIEQIRTTFNANFNDYLGTLEGELNDIVDRAKTVDTLPSSNSLETAIKDGLKRFTETQFTAIAVEVDACSIDLADKLRTDLHGMQLPIRSDRSQTFFQNNPDMFTPMLLVVAFPLTHFFTFAYLAIGAMFGANIVQQLVQKISSNMALSKVRPELKRQLGELLQELKPKMTEWSEPMFEELRRRACSRLRSVSTIQVNGIPNLDNDQTEEMTDSARSIKRRLLEWTVDGN